MLTDFNLSTILDPSAASNWVNNGLIIDGTPISETTELTWLEIEHLTFDCFVFGAIIYIVLRLYFNAKIGKKLSADIEVLMKDYKYDRANNKDFISDKL